MQFFKLQHCKLCEFKIRVRIRVRARVRIRDRVSSVQFIDTESVAQFIECTIHIL